MIEPTMRETIAKALYDYFNPMELNDWVEMSDMRHAADDVIRALEMVDKL